MSSPQPPDPAGPDRPAGRDDAAGLPAAPMHGPTPGRHAPDPWLTWLRNAAHLAAAGAADLPTPAWLRPTRGERRWPITLSIAVAVVLQILLPPHLTGQLLPRWLMPAIEGALLVGLTAADPFRVERGGMAMRSASIVLLLIVTVANGISAGLLIKAIIEGQGTGAAGSLLGTGASVWVTNVIAFSLWYWEFDRGGPVVRAAGTSRHPDLMFPQMASPELAPPDWEPQFVDYFYLSFTNATAFSPTDVMPLARWAKLTMLVQSAVSLAIGALVIARAVNILKT
jgi:uncharacterized membrane protein